MLSLNHLIPYMQKGFAGFIAFICSFLAIMSIGVFGTLLFKLYLLEKDIKQNFIIEVVLDNKVKKDAALDIAERIKRSNYCLEANFVSKEEAIEIVKSEVGTEIVDFLDINPLYNSIQFKLKSVYTTSYSINMISTQIMNIKGVKDVRFSDAALLNLEQALPIVQLTAIISVSVIGIFAVLVIFFITRLKLVFDAQKIETLKLFGASRWFIIKPHFLWSLFYAFFATLLALIVIFVIGYYLNMSYPSLHLMNDFFSFGQYYILLFVFSIILIPLSTMFALIRYLKY